MTHEKDTPSGKGGGAFWKWLAGILVSGMMASMGFVCIVALDTRNEVSSIKATLNAAIVSGHERDDKLDERVSRVESNVARIDKNQSRVMDKIGITPSP